MKVGDLDVPQVLMADSNPKMAKEATALVRRDIKGTAIQVSSSHFPGLEFGRLLPGAGKPYWSCAPDEFVQSRRSDRGLRAPPS